MNQRQNVQRIYQERPEVIRGGKENRKTVPKRGSGNYDYVLLAAVGLIFAFGLLVIYSSSQYTAMLENNDATYYFRKQLLIGGGSLVAALILSKFDYHLLDRFTIVPLGAYLAALLFPLLTLFLGFASNGKTRWLSIGGFSFQPAELTKLGIIVSLAWFLGQVKRNINDKKVFVFTMIACGAPAMLIFTQNLSSGFIVFFIACVMLFVASNHWKFFAAAGTLGILAFAVSKPLVRFAVTKMNYTGVPSKYWLRRILAWALPEVYTNDAYQTTQGLYAIGSGGLTGRGLGESIQKFGKIPEVQNDMIFTVICEEFGFLGALTVILLYALIIWRIYKVAREAKDRLGSLLCVGVMAHIGIQVILNLAVVTGAFPNTGVTLPFISYGGSAVMFTMLEIGVVLCVSNRNTGETS